MPTCRSRRSPPSPARPISSGAVRRDHHRHQRRDDPRRRRRHAGAASESSAHSRRTRVRRSPLSAGDRAAGVDDRRRVRRQQPRARRRRARARDADGAAVARRPEPRSALRSTKPSAPAWPRCCRRRSRSWRGATPSATGAPASTSRRADRHRRRVELGLAQPPGRRARRALPSTHDGTLDDAFPLLFSFGTFSAPFAESIGQLGLGVLQGTITVNAAWAAPATRTSTTSRPRGRNEARCSSRPRRARRTPPTRYFGSRATRTGSPTTASAAAAGRGATPPTGTRSCRRSAR